MKEIKDILSAEEFAMTTASKLVMSAIFILMLIGVSWLDTVLIGTRVWLWGYTIKPWMSIVACVEQTAVITAANYVLWRWLPSKQK